MLRHTTRIRNDCIERLDRDLGGQSGQRPADALRGAQRGGADSEPTPGDAGHRAGGIYPIRPEPPASAYWAVMAARQARGTGQLPYYAYPPGMIEGELMHGMQFGAAGMPPHGLQFGAAGMPPYHAMASLPTTTSTATASLGKH